MKKIRLTKELMDKSASVFMVRKQIKTNDGLSRAELRCLERKGIVSSKMFQGINIWFVNKSGIQEMVGKVFQ